MSRTRTTSDRSGRSGAGRRAAARGRRPSVGGALPPLLALALAACGGASPPDADPPAETGSSEVPATAASAARVYACPDGLRYSVRARRDSVLIALPARRVTLGPVVSASGARYEGGGVVFWSKGEEATLTADGTAHADCRGTPVETPWEEARLRGIEFRAVGQEPGWVLEVDRGRSLYYLGDYGTSHVATPYPEPEGDTAGGTLAFEARTEAHDLAATIEAVPCRDTMSGERFSHTVTVRVDGRELRGCGRRLDTGDP